MLLRRLKNSINPYSRIFSCRIKQNIVTKRWSGHDTMVIEPSSYQWKKFKDACHFYFLMGTIPITVIISIISVRSNPELSEIPEGYEPRHWEYYKHPLTRFTARYLFQTAELDHEMSMALCEDESENNMLKRVTRKADRVMKFYNDHRSQYFRPFYAELYRSGRVRQEHDTMAVLTTENIFYEAAYDPNVNPVPTEGYVPSNSD